MNDFLEQYELLLKAVAKANVLNKARRLRPLAAGDAARCQGRMKRLRRSLEMFRFCINWRRLIALGAKMRQKTRFYMDAGSENMHTMAAATRPETAMPHFESSKPWRVLSFKVEAGNLCVETQDSSGATGTLVFNRDDLRLVQYVSSSDLDDPTRKLYAELIAPPGLPFTRSPHRIVYLGQTTSQEFPGLRQPLERGGVEWVRYTKPRRENMKDLLPKTWGVQKVVPS